MGRVQLDAAADGLENLGGARHAAKAEIIRRDREYAEEQERSRREFETARDQRPMDHAAALADKQLSAAIDVAKATKFAAWAAGFSACGAVVAAIVEVIRFVCGG
jgi:hypothetical protein